MSVVSKFSELVPLGPLEATTALADEPAVDIGSIGKGIRLPDLNARLNLFLVVVLNDPRIAPADLIPGVQLSGQRSLVSETLKAANEE